MSYVGRLEGRLQERKRRKTLRSLDPTPQTSFTELVDLSSNDYLSLSRSTELHDRLLSRLTDGEGAFGPPSSRLLDGNSPAHLALEQRLASFFCADAALLFNSGFDANAGLWGCLPGEADYIVYDELIHASVHDGMRACRAKGRRAFRHNDVEHLRSVLGEIVRSDERVRRGLADIWLSVEALYSMDGDLAPLESMASLLDEVLPRGNGHLVVDEAHATGLYGPRGRGLVCHLGLAQRTLIRVHTFGKSMACSGAVVLCNPLIRSYLINYARPLIYSTVMPFLNVHAINSSLDMFEEGYCEAASAHAHALAAHLLAQLRDLPPSRLAELPPPLAEPSYSPLALAPSPIVPVLTTTPLELAAHLQRSGFLVRALRYPTVPRGAERVRVCLHAANTFEEVDRLLEAVRRWIVDQDEPRARL